MEMVYCHLLCSNVFLVVLTIAAISQGVQPPSYMLGTKSPRACGSHPHPHSSPHPETVTRCNSTLCTIHILPCSHCSPSDFYCPLSMMSRVAPQHPCRQANLLASTCSTSDAPLPLIPSFVVGCSSNLCEPISALSLLLVMPRKGTTQRSNTATAGTVHLTPQCSDIAGVPA